MLAIVAKLNRDDIDGILISFAEARRRKRRSGPPDKDVDGFHPANAAPAGGQPGLQPSPAGIIEILKRSGLPIAGQNAVVVGRPTSSAASRACCRTVRDRNDLHKGRGISSVTRNADILVAAIPPARQRRNVSPAPR